MAASARGRRQPDGRLHQHVLSCPRRLLGKGGVRVVGRVYDYRVHGIRVVREELAQRRARELGAQLAAASGGALVVGVNGGCELGRGHAPGGGRIAPRPGTAPHQRQSNHAFSPRRTHDPGILASIAPYARRAAAGSFVPRIRSRPARPAPGAREAHA